MGASLRLSRPWSTKAGWPSRAHSLLARLDGGGGGVGVVPNLVSFSTALSACVALRDVARADALAAEMTRRGIPPDTVALNFMMQVPASLPA